MFDMAGVSTRNGQLTALEHRGNNFLGGKDIDRPIMDEFFLPTPNREYRLPETGSPERQRGWPLRRTNRFRRRTC